MDAPNSWRSGSTDGETAVMRRSAHTAAAPPLGARTCGSEPSRGPRLVDGVPEGLGKLVDPFGGQVQAVWRDRLLIPQHLVGDALAHDLLLQQLDPVDQ